VQTQLHSITESEEYSCCEQRISNFSSEIGRQPVEFVAATKSDKQQFQNATTMQ
jgi:hypothetical protein